MLIRNFNSTWKKQDFSRSMSEISDNIYLLDNIYLFPLEFVFIYSISLMYKCLRELIKRRSKVQEKYMSCERALNFDQWKSFSKKYKLVRVWLWLAYKFTENNCCLRLSTEFIQTQKKYPTCLDKINIFDGTTIIIW